jgi:hypothetical protein
VKLSFLFIFITCFAEAQIIVKGFISDSISGKAIAFAGVGIVGKPLGTVTNEDGKFELLLGDYNSSDTLKIMAIGYTIKSYAVQDIKSSLQILLAPLNIQLEEVVVKAKKIKYTVLGNQKYTKNNCSGFVKNESNWKGSEAAILAGNKDGRMVRIESFSFFIIQNKYEDSLVFRLMFYEASDKKYPRMKTFLRKPVIFKTALKQGEFVLDLKDFNISTDKDFFISLECLMDELDISKFCYAGSYATPSFVKTSAFARWHRIRGGGGDFNVKVSYPK